MNLLIVAAGYKPSWIYGGPTISVSSLAEALAEAGVAVTVMTTNANGKDDFPYPNGYEEIINGVKVIYYRRWTGDPTSIAPRHTWAMLRSIHQYDRVHINGWWNWVAMMALIVCKITGTPHVLSTRGALSEYTFQTPHTSRIKRIMHSLFFKRMLGHTRLHVTSEEEAERFRRALPGASVIVLPNILPLPEPKHTTKSTEGPLRLVFLGRIDPVKNLELLIDTLNKVRFPFQLTLIGDGKPEYIKAILARSMQPDRILQIGPVYDERKYAFLGDAELLVLLSHSENFGNVVIEALSQGTPVLLSRQVGLSHWVEEHQAGWVTEPNVQACKQQLESIYAERDQLEPMRSHVRAQVTRDFSSAKLATRYIRECYQQVHAATEPPKPKWKTA